MAGPLGAAVSASLAGDLITAIHDAGDPVRAGAGGIVSGGAFQGCRARSRSIPDYETEKVLAAASDALREAFSFANRQFGQPVVLSEVIALLQAVAGVVAVDLDSLYRTGHLKKLNARLEADLPNGGDPASLGAAELLTLDPAPLRTGGDAMSYDPDRLYNLLPAVHRIRDAEQGEPLRQLLALINQQVGILEEDLEQLYDNQFIETCAPWVLPYIGDLIGYRLASSDRTGPAHAARGSGEHDRLPAAQRDRLGPRTTGRVTSTGWNARAVEFFQLLGWTQFMNHVRLTNYYAPDMREWEPLERLGTRLRDERAHRSMCGTSRGAKANTTSRTSAFSSGA